MRKFALLLLLAGCGTATLAPTVASPVDVILYRDTITVEMSDGTLCTGVRRGGGGAAWSGTLGGCPHALPFTAVRTTPQPRLVLRPDSDGTSPNSATVGTQAFGA